MLTFILNGRNVVVFSVLFEHVSPFPIFTLVKPVTLSPRLTEATPGTRMCKGNVTTAKVTVSVTEVVVLVYWQLFGNSVSSFILGLPLFTSSLIYFEEQKRIVSTNLTSSNPKNYKKSMKFGITH